MSDFPFHTIDMIILAGLVWSAFLGFTRGIVREVAAILALAMAIVGSLVLFTPARGVVAQYVDLPVVTNAVTGGGLFLLLYGLSRLLFSSLKGKADAAQMNGLDRGLGFTFGVGRAGLLFSVLMLGVNWLVPHDKQPHWMTDFQSRPLLEKGGETLKGAIPEKALDSVMADMKALQKLGAEWSHSEKETSEGETDSGSQDDKAEEKPLEGAPFPDAAPKDDPDPSDSPPTDTELGL